MQFLSFISAVLTDGPQLMELPISQDGTRYTNYLLTNVPADGEWSMLVNNSQGGELPAVTYSQGGSSSQPIQPVMSEQMDSGMSQTFHNPAMGYGQADQPQFSMGQPSGPAPVPVTGSPESGVPQAGSQSQPATTKSCDGSNSSKDKSSSSTKNTKSSSNKDSKKKKDSARSVGIIAGLLGVLFCIVAA